MKKNTASLLKKLLSVKGHYIRSTQLLAEKGYTDEYMELLKTELESAKKKKEIAEGQAFLAQAYLFRGELKKAEEAFAHTDYANLPKHVDSVFFNNYIVCLFLLGGNGHMKEILRIYEEHNREILADNTLVMRRTVGIHEYCEKRYENAVTVFIKLLSEPDPRVNLYADICLVRSLLELDMADRAREIAEMGFPRYTAKGDITAIVSSLERQIASDNRENRIKSKKGGKKHGK